MVEVKTDEDMCDKDTGNSETNATVPTPSPSQVSTIPPPAAMTTKPLPSTEPVEPPKEPLPIQRKKGSRKSLSVPDLTTVLLALLPLLLVTVAFFIPSTDASLKDSVDVLESTLKGLLAVRGHTDNASVSTLRTLSEGLKDIKKITNYISDDCLHRLETGFTEFARLLKYDVSESDGKANNGIQVAFDEFSLILAGLGQRVGSFYFIEKDELKIQFYETISKAVYNLRDIALQHSDLLGGFSSDLQRQIGRKLNFRQLLVDLGIAASFCVLICRLSAHRKWPGIALVVLLAAGLQALQWNSRSQWFQSISPPATATIVALLGFASMTLSVKGTMVQLPIALLVLLTAIAFQIFFHPHVCTIRSALGAPCVAEMPCPISALKIAEYNNQSKHLFITKEAEYRLPKLNGPLYVLSEIGGFNTGKSARLTVSYRLLLPRNLRRKCKCGFFVRNADADPTLVYTGKTRDLWMMSLPVSQIDVTDIGSDPLTRAVKRLDQTGTIIFLDSEGGEEMGRDVASINLMQLLVVEISSHMSVAVKEVMSLSTIKHLGMLAHLCKLYSAFEVGRQSCQLTGQPSNVAAVSHPELAIISMKGSELLPLFPDIKASGGQVISLPKIFSLDATKVLQTTLEKAITEPTSRDAASQVKEYMPGLAYWGTLPATPDEIVFFMNMDTRSGLPAIESSGFVMGWSKFNLPAILNWAQPKRIQTDAINGKQMLNFMRQFLHITLKINETWLRAESTKDLSNTICQYTHDKVKPMLLDAKLYFAEKLPIEPNPVCLAFKDLCPDAEYEKVWSTIFQNITETTCFMKSLMPENGWSNCWKELIEPDVSELHRELLSKHREMCVYQWNTGEWNSTCEGNCPGYRSRGRQCVNKRYELRLNRCCSLEAEPEVKQSCESWSYKWSLDAWSPCDKYACGTQSRTVRCLRCDGKHAEDEMCLLHVDKPSTSQQCNIRYTFETGEWSQNCGCGVNQKRDVYCQSNCGHKVENSHCSNIEVPDRDRYCGHCPSSSSGGGGGCFGARNFARAEDSSTLGMTSLRPGLRILSASFSDTTSTPVVEVDEVAFVMTTQRPMSNFVTLQTAINTSITVTDDHLLPVRSGYTATAIELLPAGDLKPDRHLVLTATHDLSNKLRWTPISHVRSGVTDFPVVLLTMHDYAVVGNIVASCHTGSEMIGKAISLPLKVIYRALGASAVDSDIVHSAVDIYDKLIGY